MPHADPEENRRYMREYMREYRENGHEALDPEREAARKRQWYLDNKERKAENQRRWRARQKAEKP